MDNNKIISLRDELYNDTLNKKLKLIKERNMYLIENIKKHIDDTGETFLVDRGYSNSDIDFIKSNDIDVIPVTMGDEVIYVVYWGKKEDLDEMMNFLGFSKGVNEDDNVKE